VFTRGEQGGNHLGVVTDLTGLDTDSMQTIATELGFSETTFVETETGDVPFVRIFTPSMEIPFAGHPLVGTAWALDVLGSGVGDRLRCGIGEVGVRLTDDLVWIDAALDQPVHDARDTGVPGRAGLAEPEAGWLVEMPADYLVLRYPNPDVVADLDPTGDSLGDVFGVLAYARHGSAVRARFWAPGAGVVEDPATGSAAVALAAVQVNLGEPDGTVDIDQGEEIGFPSRIRLSWTEEHASIGGTVVHDETRVLDR
jgi:trans-2,3-dihydro-3-hydroxyanthranilate isomerase